MAAKILSEHTGESNETFQFARKQTKKGSPARTRVQEGGCCWHRPTIEKEEERETRKTCDGAEKTSVQATAWSRKTEKND